MTSPKYGSTNRKAPKLSFGEALLKGLAPDRGLYMPDFIPQFSIEEIKAISSKTYPEIAFEVLYKYLKDEIGADELKAMVDDAFDFDVPLENGYENSEGYPGHV